MKPGRKTTWKTTDLAVLGALRWCRPGDDYAQSVRELSMAIFGQADSISKSRVNDALGKIRRQRWLYVDLASHRSYGERKLYGLHAAAEVRAEVCAALNAHDLPELPLMI